MSKTRKIAAIVAWTITAAFLVGVAAPLAVDRMLVRDDLWRSLFISYQLKDQGGQRHIGFVATGWVPLDADFFEYGFEAPAGKDLSSWHQKIIGVSRDKITRTDGFVWSDKGFLWADDQHLGNVKILEGTRLGLDRPIPRKEQTELTVAGAPWDVRTPMLSFFGRFPDYKVDFENDDFKFDWKLKSSTPSWYMYNNGVPFAAGDFGKGSMDELNVDVTGTITHKRTGEQFQVSGTGLMEHAVGVPYSWLDWGGHDWDDVHFPGGWNGSLWVAKDDWQWGYHRDPRIGWIWDPEQKKFLTFYRVEIVNEEPVVDAVNGLDYPKHSLWRAYGPDATLEVENTNLTFKPRESIMPYVHLPLAMSYGNHTMKGRLIRRDGSVVDLGTGIGTMEHFIALIPDYVFWGPFSLIMLVLSWSTYSGVARRESGRSVAPPVIACMFGLLAVFCLYIAWL